MFSESKNLNSQTKQAFLADYPDFEVSCCADGDLVDVNLSRCKEINSKEGAGGRFEGRQLPKGRMRRLIFSKPASHHNPFPGVSVLICYRVLAYDQEADESQRRTYGNH